MTPSFGLPVELAELADEYDFIEELGRGGSAIVYRARDRALDRDVAIKVVHPRATSPDDDPVARLAREARTVAQLHHPGIVSVYAVRRLRAGGLTLVMQFVPGATLKQSIQRGGPFSSARTEAILRDVAQALAYAHARQVIHRDVKPENIFLDAASGRALLADFGIARSAEADSLTMTGTAIGTPFYMSPEQVDGVPVDGRSDVYSLGLVAWEMLTGLRPWDGESLYHVIYKQKHDELPPIEGLRRDVPRRLQYIVERMLQKQPAARWAGADGLLAQLDCTILPADYAHWQAALPARVARHRTVSGLQRSPDAHPSEAAAAGAATVQFTAARDRASDRGAPPPAREADAITSVPVAAPASVPGPSPCVDSTVDLLAPGSPDVVDALAGSRRISSADTSGPPTYDSVAPSWTYVDPDAPQRAVRVWGRRALPGAALVAAAATVTAVVLRSPSVLRPIVVHGALADLGVAGFEGARQSRTDLSRWMARRTPAGAAGVPMVDPSQFARADLITLGAHHGCSITLAGAAQCWGHNDAAQLGDGSSTDGSAAPRLVAGVMTYSGLSAGASHTCGVTQAGDVYCWGANLRGQLGDGTTLVRSAPVRVAGAGTYRLVRAGAAHTCALDVDRLVRCWGDNRSGQLGDGTQTSQPLPAAVQLRPSAIPVALAVGAQHSCVLLSDGRVLCWGSNRDGQLGVANAQLSTTPREVPGVRASAIGAGDAHTCVVLRSGLVQCWGRDASGQLGLGDQPRDSPGRLTAIPGDEDVRAVVAGADHSCALTHGGWVWCWGGVRAGGRNRLIRLGDGPYAAVAAGGDASCAVPSERTIECWSGARTDRTEALLGGRSGGAPAASSHVPRT